MTSYTRQEDFEQFFGNNCNGCGEVFGPLSLTQVGRPVYIESRGLPRIKYCAFCTVHHALHHNTYLRHNGYQVTNTGMPIGVPSCRLLSRLLDAQHDLDEPYDERTGCIVALPQDKR